MIGTLFLDLVMGKMTNGVKVKVMYACREAPCGSYKEIIWF